MAEENGEARQEHGLPSTGDSALSGTERFKMSFTNAGVGPAKIQSVKLVFDDQPVTDWDQAVQRMGGKPGDIESRNFISRRVLRPDETVDLFSTRAPDLVRSFQAEMADPENYMTFCYCSIFDACWLADTISTCRIRHWSSNARISVLPR